MQEYRVSLTFRETKNIENTALIRGTLGIFLDFSINSLFWYVIGNKLRLLQM